MLLYESPCRLRAVLQLANRTPRVTVIIEKSSLNTRRYTLFSYIAQYCHFYRPQTKFAKVMFLHLSVSHSVHGGACVVVGGMCMAGGGRHAWWGVCMVGVCMAGGHACHTHPLPTLRDTVGQCAGGTHPTGMHSCLKKWLWFILERTKFHVIFHSLTSFKTICIWYTLI